MGPIEGWIDPEHSAHLGIRAPYTFSEALGYTVLDTVYIREHTPEEIAADITYLIAHSRRGPPPRPA